MTERQNLPNVRLEAEDLRKNVSTHRLGATGLECHDGFEDLRTGVAGRAEQTAEVPIADGEIEGNVANLD